MNAACERHVDGKPHRGRVVVTAARAAAERSGRAHRQPAGAIHLWENTGCEQRGPSEKKDAGKSSGRQCMSPPEERSAGHSTPGNPANRWGSRCGAPKIRSGGRAARAVATVNVPLGSSAVTDTVSPSAFSGSPWLLLPLGSCVLVGRRTVACGGGGVLCAAACHSSATTMIAAPGGRLSMGPRVAAAPTGPHPPPSTAARRVTDSSPLLRTLGCYQPRRRGGRGRGAPPTGGPVPHLAGHAAAGAGT